jgi:hypothetical protein
MAVVEKEASLVDSPKDDPDDDWTSELTGTEPKETPPKEGEPKKEGVPEDHPTKLGRKVKELTENFSNFQSRMEAMLAKQEELLTSRYTTPAPSPSQTVEDEVPEHVKEALPYIRAELSREQKATQDYFDKYTSTVKKSREDIDEELHKEVVNELLEANFRNYKKISGDPTYDAQTNYDLAVASILKKQRRGQATRPNVRGDQETSPRGLSSSSTNSIVPPKKVEPDEFAKKFLHSIGAKDEDEWVQESLRNAK